MEYWVETLGCPKNQVDSDKLIGTLRADGYEPATGPDQADVVVVNTCAFIESARQESVDTILALADVRRSGSRLVVTGCMAERYGTELAELLPEVDQVTGFNVAVSPAAVEMGGQAVSLGPTRGPGRQGGAPADLGLLVPELPSFDLLNLPRPASSAPWAYLKVAEGCDRACGFCAIPSFRGKQRSRTRAELLDEVDLLRAQEIVLVAQDLASYGRDIGDAGAIVPLVEAISERVDRVRLLYLYPSQLTPRLVDAIGATGCAYFDLSLQHVSRPHLARMRRWGEGERFADRMARIRDQWPEAAFRSSFIVGYPGETEDDHDLLLAFLETAQLDWAGFFAYSREDGTYAADLPDQIAPELMGERLAECNELQDRITSDRRQALVGTSTRVLVDAPGRARSHREAPEIDGIIRVPDDLEVGSWVDVTVTGAEGPDLDALPVTVAAGLMATRVAGKFESSALATPANAITMMRVVATPFMILLIVDVGVAWVTVLVWVALSSTDFVDGWVARRQGATTSGAFLDPLADKFLVLGALAALAAGGLTSWLPVVIIAARELVISAYRSVVARRGVSVPARPLAKAKTAVQDLSITLLLLPFVGDHHGWIGRDLLWVAVVLAVASAAQYLLDSRGGGTAGAGPVSTTGRVG